MKDAPDGTLWVQHVNVVIDAPIPPEPANEVAAGHVGRYTGTDTVYQTVASWTVATGKVGELKEITILTSDYDKTYFRVTIGSVVFASEWMVQAAMPLVFEDLKLAAAAVVSVEAKSSDGTSITVDAVITAKEIG